jgi:hypothetical protein
VRNSLKWTLTFGLLTVTLSVDHVCTTHWIKMVSFYVRVAFAVPIPRKEPGYSATLCSWQPPSRDVV